MARDEGRQNEGIGSKASGRDQVRWKKLFEEQAASGLSQAAFCRARGIPARRFQYWRYDRPSRLARLPRSPRRGSQVAASVRLVPVKIVKRPVAPPRGESASSGVEVLLPGGLRVALQRGFDGSVLRDAVEALRC